ncbi:MAG TPA: hypothetical protein VGP68_04175 [Gemmataceae bacterium]|jgi:hypothetical protein|nr:hypothetical protein [Gemmataceae bacterium]
MLALFCLRLAGGLLACLLLLRPAQVNPRFFRVQFLTALGLSVVAAFFLRGSADLFTWIVLGAGMGLCFLGSLVWSLERAPGGVIFIVSAAVATITALLQAAFLTFPDIATSTLAIDQLASGLLLGMATTAMLMGHSYLIAPSMSLRPLLVLIGGFFAALVLRGAVGGWGLWDWTREHPLLRLNEVNVLLPVRWVVGLVGPAILNILALQTARIRSTQSATGILYVVVILTFLGEVVSQVLFQMTSFLL